MRGCAIRPAFVTRQIKLSEAPRCPARCLHTTPSRWQSEDRPTESARPQVRSRSAVNADRVWDQVSQLPSGSKFTFGDAARAIGGRSLGDSMTRDRPREVVRRTSSSPQTQRSQPQRGEQYRSGQDGARAAHARISRQDPVERARSDIVRYERSGAAGRDNNSPRGAGAGRGRGGARGRGRGRGGAGSGGLQRRQRGLDEDDEDEGTDDWEEYTGMYQLLTSDENIDSFASLNEAQSYARLQDFVNEYDEAVTLAEAVTDDALQTRKETPEDIAARHEDALESWDADVSEALQHLVDTDEKAYPRHEPGTFAVDAAIGELGSAPVGQAGMGNIIEDGLRYVSNRELNEWRDAKELARKLVAGDFVKFRNLPEKTEVLHLAESVGYKADKAEGQEHCGFEPPSQEAKELLVQRFVQGKYRDPQDAKLNSEVLRNAARIAGGNASYPAAGKSALLNTIRGLLPAERGGQTAGQQVR